MKFFGFATVLQSMALVTVVSMFIFHYGAQFSAHCCHSDISVFVSII
jgi:hypothetical protein